MSLPATQPDSVSILRPKKPPPVTPRLENAAKPGGRVGVYAMRITLVRRPGGLPCPGRCDPPKPFLSTIQSDSVVYTTNPPDGVAARAPLYHGITPRAVRRWNVTDMVTRSCGLPPVTIKSVGQDAAHARHASSWSGRSGSIEDRRPREDFGHHRGGAGRSAGDSVPICCCGKDGR